MDYSSWDLRPSDVSFPLNWYIFKFNIHHLKSNLKEDESDNGQKYKLKWCTEITVSDNTF